MREIKINSNEANQRVDKFLSKYLDKANKSFIYKMLRKKNITLNNKKSDGSEKLNEGDIIKIFFTEETLEKFSSKPDKNNIISSMQKVSKIDVHNIIYEDDNLILYNKPAGELSQKAEVNDMSVNEQLIRYMLDNNEIKESEFKTFKPSVCNRLDRNTSGMLIFGKSMAGLQTMAELLRNRDMHKYYLCIVRGIITKEEEITGYLTKDRKNNKVKIVKDNIDSKREYIRTKYIPICNNKEYTLLKVLLITGKTHQIRAHLSSIGHSIIGDVKYGEQSVNSYFKKEYGLKYQLLHSYELQFDNVDGALSYLSNKKFTAPLSDRFIQIINGEKLNGNLEQ